MSNKGKGKEEGPETTPIPWPWSPIPLNSPPSDAFNIDNYKPKTPWVQKISIIYERPLPGDEVQRTFTTWQNGLFYALPIDSLRALVNSPAKIKSLGDSAETFSAFYVQGRLPDEYELLDPASSEKHGSDDDRDGSDDDRDGSDDDRVSILTAIDETADNPETLKRKVSIASFSGSIKSTIKKSFFSLKRKLSKHDSGQMNLEEIAQGRHGVSDVAAGSFRKKFKLATSKTAKKTSTAKKKQSDTIVPSASKRKAAQGKAKLVRKKRSKPAPRDKFAVPKAVHARDKKACVVMKTEGAVHLGHISPFSINASPEALIVFETTFGIAKALFPDRFASELQALFGSKCSSDKDWNVLTFNPYIHALLDKGFVNLKPLYIEEKLDEILPSYLVTFSFHWMFKNRVLRSCGIEPDDSNFRRMFIPLDDCEDTTDAICAYDIYGRRIPDGKVIQVQMDSLKSAQKMLSSIALRWAAGEIWFLQGAVGLSRDDNLHGNESDDDDDYSLPRDYYDSDASSISSPS